jgi:hypothetical protein
MAAAVEALTSGRYLVSFETAHQEKTGKNAQWATTPKNLHIY